MKLKAKFQDEDFKLGEIVDATFSGDEEIWLNIHDKEGGVISIKYKSLADLNDEWEDAD